MKTDIYRFFMEVPYRIKQAGKREYIVTIDGVTGHGTFTSRKEAAAVAESLIILEATAWPAQR